MMGPEASEYGAVRQGHWQPVGYSYACRCRLVARRQQLLTEQKRLAMPAPITDRQPRRTRQHKHTVQKETVPSGVPTCELPSRAALTARLEAQRAELLRVMECVNRARRTLEEHIVGHWFTSERHRFNEQRVLESLDDAQQSLAAAYPMLERIAKALHADEILKEHES